MTTALGARYLARYAAGTATRAQLDSIYALGHISDEDYAAATAAP